MARWRRSVSSLNEIRMAGTLSDAGQWELDGSGCVGFLGFALFEQGDEVIPLVPQKVGGE